MALAKLGRDRHITPGVAQTDRRRDVERPFLTPIPAGPGVQPRHRGAEAARELTDEQVHLHRVAGQWDVSAAVEGDHFAVRQLGEQLAPPDRTDLVVVPVYQQDG